MIFTILVKIVVRSQNTTNICYVTQKWLSSAWKFGEFQENQENHFFKPPKKPFCLKNKIEIKSK